MIKTMIFIRRKAGMTREAFRDRYESGHVPLAISAMLHAVRYQRNYVRPVRGMEEPDFDVVTECWFEDWETMKATAAHLRDPDVRRTIADDEAEFMDRASIRVTIVEEEETDPAQLLGTRALLP